MDVKEAVTTIDWSLVYLTQNGKAVVLNKRTGQPVILNEMAALMLASSDGKSFAEAMVSLGEIYDVSTEVLEQDLRTLLKEMQAHGVARKILS